MKKTIITGGCGFIGAALASRLARYSDESDEIILVDTMQRHGRSEFIETLLSKRQIRLIQADLTKPEAYSKLPASVDRVYHLAAVVGVDLVEADPVGTMRTNTLSTMNLFDWFVDHAAPGARLLFSSSSEIYSGAGIAGYILPIPTPEDVPAIIPDLGNPRFSYAVTKMWGEAYAIYLAARRNAFTISVRYHNVYGPGMGYNHVIPQVISRVMMKENPFRVIAGEQTRSFCWIDDAVKATHLIMESGKVSAGVVVHIGNNDEEIEIKKLYDLIFELCDWMPQKVVRASAPDGSVFRRCPDTKQLKRLTGYKPDTSLRECLKKVVEWYKENPR